jgi:hypothetical protein
VQHVIGIFFPGGRETAVTIQSKSSLARFAHLNDLRQLRNHIYRPNTAGDTIRPSDTSSTYVACSGAFETFVLDGMKQFTWHYPKEPN